MEQHERSVRGLVRQQGMAWAALLVVALVYMATAYSLQLRSSSLRIAGTTADVTVREDAGRLAEVQAWQEGLLALAYEPKAGGGPGQGAGDLARVQGWQEGLLALAYEPSGQAGAAEQRQWYAEMHKRWAWQEYEMGAAEE